MAKVIGTPEQGVAPWRPWGFERTLEDVLGRSALPSVWRRLPVEAEWLPAIEVIDKEDKYVVRAELPGMKEADVDVSVVGGDTLHIKGEKKTEAEVKDKDYYFSERSYGSFFRSIGLPSHVDNENIEASFEDGVLEVSLPKAPDVKPKKISILAKKKAPKKERPDSK